MIELYQQFIWILRKSREPAPGALEGVAPAQAGALPRLQRVDAEGQVASGLVRRRPLRGEAEGRADIEAELAARLERERRLQLAPGAAAHRNGDAAGGIGEKVAEIEAQRERRLG